MKIKKIDCKRFLQIVNGTIDKDFKNIRMVKSYSWSLNGNSTYNYAYLGLKDRIVVSADYGFAKYKGYELLNCEECYENSPQLRMKVFIVKAPCGEYEDYQEPIVKVFLDKAKAKKYVAEENAKLPLEQARKCDKCYFKWRCIGQKGKTAPDCFDGDKYGYCKNYNKYRDVQGLFMEEHEVEE